VTRIVINQCLMRLRQERRARLVYGVRSVRRRVVGLVRREISRIALLLHDVDQLPMPEVGGEIATTAGTAGIEVAAGKA
jgi:hypothetical protein